MHVFKIHSLRNALLRAYRMLFLVITMRSGDRVVLLL